VIEYSRQAEQMGAAGVMLAAPYYSLPTADELVEHFRAVSDSIGVPIMLYNYPGRTGVDMTPELIERLAQLEQVEYVKESSGDVTRVSEITRRCGDRVTVFCGCDTLALESFVLGAAGWVGGVVNVLPKAHVELYDLAVSQKEFLAAREPYYRLLPALALMEGGGKYTQLVKAGCELTGHPVGPPRRPLLPPTPEEIARLEEALRPFTR
jgi:4-hydroxy-tetrahydrodipicolinate synthase